MRTEDFDFTLPSELVAQVPSPQRGESRLLVLSRSTGQLQHRQFDDLAEYLNPGDLVVLNDSRVLRSRLCGTKDPGGAVVELLLLEEVCLNCWWALLRPGKRVRVGTRLWLNDLSQRSTRIAINVVEKNAEGHYLLSFLDTSDIRDQLDQVGEIPLPPYIKRHAQRAPVNDYERYQTVYAERTGSVAAPTAGLHITEHFLAKIQARGVRISYVTLHVGLGTFAPVKAEEIDNHVMHEEKFEVNAHTTAAIDQTRRSGRRVVAVGTTTTRVLETLAAGPGGLPCPLSGRTGIFIYPPYRFQCVDALVTNFHLPRSTLLMLVSAFAAPNETRGREIILAAYAEAIQARYRFFSYGDAMLIM